MQTHNNIETKQECFSSVEYDQALNMISAGDEHVLAILKRTEYAKNNSTLKNKRITYVQWDHDKMVQRREKEANENSGYFIGGTWMS